MPKSQFFRNSVSLENKVEGNMNFIRCKLYNKHVLVIVFLISLNLSLAQEIQFGSNNGNYVEVNDAKLYYETYGDGTPLIFITWRSWEYF